MRLSTWGIVVAAALGWAGCDFHPPSRGADVAARPADGEPTAAPRGDDGAGTGDGRGHAERDGVVGGGCAGGKVTLQRANGPARELSNEQALALPGSIEIADGRHRGQRGLPLSVLVAEHPSAAAIYLEQCRGVPLRIPRATIDAEPSRYVIAQNSKSELKLVDGSPGRGEPKQLARGITRIVVEPLGAAPNH